MSTAMASISTGELTRLGDGPVATVYSALRDGIPVAYKVFGKKFDKRTMAAYGKERSALAAQRRETSILQVDGIDELSGGEFALRMDLCLQPLARAVERHGPLGVDEVIVVGRAAALALSAAHQAGVVHGGISPHNVLFRRSGEPVVSDFGLTLRHALARDPLHAIEYLPPETLRTGVLNESTDLYGLGAVLHFALTGRSPHPGRLGEQPGERVLRILGGPVPAINANGVPTALSTLVARLLAVDPTMRPHDAGVIADQLGVLLPEPPPKRSPAEDFDDFAPTSSRRVPPPPRGQRPQQPRQAPPPPPRQQQPASRPADDVDDFDDFSSPVPSAPSRPARPPAPPAPPTRPSPPQVPTGQTRRMGPPGRPVPPAGPPRQPSWPHSMPHPQSGMPQPPGRPVPPRPPLAQPHPAVPPANQPYPAFPAPPSMPSVDSAQSPPAPARQAPPAPPERLSQPAAAGPPPSTVEPARQAGPEEAQPMDWARPSHVSPPNGGVHNAGLPTAPSAPPPAQPRDTEQPRQPILGAVPPALAKSLGLSDPPPPAQPVAQPEVSTSDKPAPAAPPADQLDDFASPPQNPAPEPTSDQPGLVAEQPNTFAAPAPPPMLAASQPPAPPVELPDDFAGPPRNSVPESISDHPDPMINEQRNVFEAPAAAPPVLRPSDVDSGEDAAWSDVQPAAEPVEPEADSFSPPQVDDFDPQPYPVEQRQDPYGMSDATLADDFGGYRKSELDTEPERAKPKKRFRYEIVGGVVLIGLIIALVVVLLGGDPEELPTNGASAEVPSADPNEVHLVLAPPDDRKKEVELTWRSSKVLDFAVIVAPEGQESKTLLAERNHSMTVAVDPDLKYCFLVQATDGEKTWDSKPVGVRGATCRT